MPASRTRAIIAAVAAVIAVHASLEFFPALERGGLIRGAAWLAALFTGSPLHPIAEGWQLPLAPVPIAVTAACSGADYCGIVAALLAWRLARRGVAVALAAALVAAPLVTVAVNACRIVSVAHVHRWFDPALSAAAGGMLHMLAGAAVFLPALIALNLLLEAHAKLAADRPA